MLIKFAGHQLIIKKRIRKLTQLFQKLNIALAQQNSQVNQNVLKKYLTKLNIN